ncbi:ABC transporter substrate-binding protein [Brevibacterium oceani]|uniref:ABC transporter substrate-binding protein n=1 Tax=Brevibacterium oceani TaxID=358099 RepID=UPI0015E68C54|nr:ABC transporter substrate-binding protein [Brevibacterium oceani]
MTPPRLLTTIGIGAAGLALLAGCGTTAVGEEAGSATSAPASESCADDTTETSTDPVEITDGVGRTVKLDKPAERVAILEWQEVEDALTLCVNPVAVADPDGYSTWVSAEKLPKDTASAGTREEPDLDSIYKADPDLIIVEGFSKDEEILDQLEKQDVPVIVARGNNPKDPVGNMKDVFSLVAKATGRTERADQVLKEFDENVEERKKDVAKVDLETKDFLFFDGWIEGGNLSLRPYTDGALFTELGKDLGLHPVWNEKVNKSNGTGGLDADYGLAQTDIEGLTAVGEANLFYANDAASGYVDELEKSSIWKNLPAAKEGRAYEFPNVWGAGGPRSTQQAVDAYADLLTK